MRERLSPMIAMFDVSDASFDAASIAKAIQELSFEKRIWNFIPGAFAFPLNNDANVNDVRDSLSNVTKATFVLTSFDILTVQGWMTEKTWDVWWFETFPEFFADMLRGRGFNLTAEDELKLLADHSRKAEKA